MRNTLQRPSAGERTGRAPDALEGLDPGPEPRQRPAWGWAIAAFAAFAVLAAILIAVLVSDGTTIAHQPLASSLSQRDLAPAVRPGETDVIVVDLAGLEATGGAEGSAPRDPMQGLMVPQ
jgi:hypothetical protein